MKKLILLTLTVVLLGISMSSCEKDKENPDALQTVQASIILDETPQPFLVLPSGEVLDQAAAEQRSEEVALLIALSGKEVYIVSPAAEEAEKLYSGIANLPTRNNTILSDSTGLKFNTVTKEQLDTLNIQNGVSLVGPFNANTTNMFFAFQMQNGIKGLINIDSIEFPSTPAKANITVKFVQ